MRTASHSASSFGRFRVLALAVSLVLASFIPTLQAARADYEDAPPGNVGGLQIVIETVEDLTDLTAVAVGGGQSINLRAEPASESDSLASIPHGSVVELRVDMIDTVLDGFQILWWPATWDGQEGWISGQFLTQATTSDGDVISTTVIPFDYTREASAHSTALVFGKGASVNVRAEPSTTGEIVAKAVDGQVVSLRIDMVDTVTDTDGVRWWPVTVAGIDGWISGFHLMESNDAPTTEPGEAVTETEAVSDQPAASEPTPAPSESPTAPSGTFGAGDFVQVFTGDGSSVNLRSTGSLEGNIVGSLSDGQLATVVSGPVASESSAAGWYEVRAGGLTGFVDGAFLVRSVKSPSSERAPQVPSEPPRSEEEEANPQPIPAEVTEPETTPTPEPSATEPPAQATSQFIYPIQESFQRTQGFGCSSLPFYTYNAAYGCALHDGLDLAAPSGTPLVAAGAGTVVVAGWCNCGLGYYVEIDHGGGIRTIYGHMRTQPIVSVGQQVSQGQQIGEVGSTGISTGPHVHFMVKVNGVSRNPENYLP